MINDLPAQSLEELIAMAMENNPSVKVSEADIQYAEAALTRSNAAYYPRADLTAEAYWR